jgi:hypothetical protein
MLRALIPGDICPTSFAYSHFKPALQSHYVMGSTFGDMGLEKRLTKVFRLFIGSGKKEKIEV